MDKEYQVKFSFYGFSAGVKCDDEETLESIKRDFSYFLSDCASPQAKFEVYSQQPDYVKLSQTEAYLHSYTPQNACYKKDGMTFIDYHGKGLTIIDDKKNFFRIYCAEKHLRHEIAFLSVLSMAGQSFDKKHIHRVHGLGLEVAGKAIVILLPSGGGKTTLLLDLIKEGSIKLISEDSPLIDKKGLALPFPIRIGVTSDNKPENIPEEHLHLIKRTDSCPKYTIDISVFKDKITVKPVPVKYILCGQRYLGNCSRIKPVAKHKAIGELIKNSVVGLGLYQGIEFLLEKGLIELFKKTGVLFSRYRNAQKIVSRSKTYSFLIGSDRKKNSETFLAFCKQVSEGKI